MDHHQKIWTRKLPATGAPKPPSHYADGDDGYHDNRRSRWYPPQKRFLVKSAEGWEFVIDRGTGLMWPRNWLTYGVGSNKTWQEAITGCNNFAYAGIDNWRLPNLFEIQTLLNVGAYPTHHPVFQNPINGYFWTSTTCYVQSTHAYRVDLGVGETLVVVKTAQHYFIATRDAYHV